MKDGKRSQFAPDYAHPPGTFLREILEDRGIRPTDFATRCARPLKTISEILAGKTAITSDTALQFERVLGDDSSATLWLAREARYQLHASREREREGLELEKEWARLFPLKEMVSKNYIPAVKDPVEQVSTLLNFFGVGSVTGWKGYWEERVTAARYKQVGQKSVNQYAVTAWLRRGDVETSDIECDPYNEGRFKQALTHLRQLTMRTWPMYRKELVTTLSTAGVAIAFVPDLQNLKLRGAAYWASKDKAVIVVSDHMKFEHRFWFALFHEAMHILLHSKKALFIDYNEKNQSDIDEEKEADKAAANALISTQQLEEFLKRYGKVPDSYSLTNINSFAEKIGIGAGLLLARLQNEGFISWNSRMNKAFSSKVVF